MNYPTTRPEAKRLKAKYYFTGKPCKRGHIALRETKGNCCECRKEDTAKEVGTRLEYLKEWNASDAGQASKKKYYEKNKEAVIARAQARPNEEKQAYRAKWKKLHPELRSADARSRRRKHKQATPKWLTQEQRKNIQNIYIEAIKLTKLTGTQYVVDHIEPLRGKTVCGLHVPWNLRVITETENLKKHNKQLAE